MLNTLPLMTTTAREATSGLEGELVKDIDLNQTYLMDGVTPGGFPVSNGVVITTNTQEILTNTETTFTIQNQDSFSTYTVTAKRGTVAFDGDSITYTAPGTVGEETLTVFENGVGHPFVFSIGPPP